MGSHRICRWALCSLGLMIWIQPWRCQSRMLHHKPHARSAQHRQLTRVTVRCGCSYKEDYSGAGATACGIHGTGIGFARMDAVEKIQIKDETEWIKWK
jgi:hypothetical protein